MDANAPKSPKKRVSFMQQTGDDDAASAGSQSAHLNGETPPTGYDGSQSEKPKSEETSLLIDGSNCDHDDQIVSKDNDAKDQTATKFTTEQKIIFACAAFAALGNWLTYTLMVVFYPVEAKKRGMSQTIIGLVFSTYAICNSLGAPLFGKLLPIVGARFVFLAGGFVTGSCNILFGFVADMPDLATFTAFSFILRIVEGLGSAACLTAVYSIVMYTFPEHVGTAVSILEMMGGLAVAIGPMLGGLIYNVGGFKLPFFILGGAVLLILFINFWFLPEIGRSDETSGSMRQVLSIPAIWIVLSCLVFASLVLAGLDPTLSLHLTSLGFSVIGRSAMYGAWGITYAFVAIFWGYVADKTKRTRFMLILGMVCSAVCLCLVGPAPFLPENKVMPIIAMPLLSVCIALVLTPTMVDMMSSAEWYIGRADLGMTAIISGLWNSGFSAGASVGPVIAGSLVDQLGFRFAFSLVAAAFLLYMGFFCLFGAWEFRCGKGRRDGKKHKEMNENTTEQTELLPIKAER